MKFKIHIILLTVILSACQVNNIHNLNYKKLDVIHIAQNDDYSCATTSLAMVISYFEEKPLDKNEVWKISGSNIFDVMNYGNDMEGLKRATEYYGYISKFKENLSIADLEKYISNGIPIVINILQPNMASATHAVLVVGFDRDKKILYINAPAKSVIGKSISYKALDNLWSANIKKHDGTGYEIAYRSGFIVYPK